MRKICRTILAAGLMACMIMPAVNVMATDDIVGNWQADEAGIGFAKISAALSGWTGFVSILTKIILPISSSPWMEMGQRQSRT